DVGDRELGKADGGGWLGRRRQRRAAGTAGGDDAAEIATGDDEALEGLRHGGDGLAAIVRENGRRALRMEARHLGGAHIGRRRLAGRAEIDGDDIETELLQAVADEAELAALGVEGTGDVGGAPGQLSYG